MKIIDLRSDTVTQPTDSMRQAMATASVGDDVLDEDPTIHDLQIRAAQLMGKESALFVPSGTMGNLTSLLTHCQRGDEVILGDRSHIFLNEVGGISALGGIQTRTVSNQEDGTITLESLESAIRSPNLHFPPSRLITLENTHNYCSGAPLTLNYMNEVRIIADRYRLKIHLDGARIFNAAVALDVNVKELTHQADSVVFCLSKSLSAPVGSLICGDRKFIEKARKTRKMLGGGMRQAGHLAAAGIKALEEQIVPLKNDHMNTRRLADGLSTLSGIKLNSDNIKTNIIFFELNHQSISPENFLTKLKEKGIKINATGPRQFRAVLHREIDSEQITIVLESIESILK